MVGPPPAAAAGLGLDTGGAEDGDVAASAALPGHGDRHGEQGLGEPGSVAGMAKGMSHGCSPIGMNEHVPALPRDDASRKRTVSRAPWRPP